MPPCPTESAISITRGSFEARPGVRYQLLDFHARLRPKAKSAPLCFERVTLVARGEIFVSSDSLTRLFSQKLEASHSKIKDFAVSHDAKGATLTGSISKLISLHFTIKGPVSTDGRSIRLEAKSIKADGIPVKELLKLVGAELNTVVPVKGIPGIEVGEDYLAFSPAAIANLEGHIAAVSTSSEGLTVRYSSVRHHAQTAR